MPVPRDDDDRLAIRQLVENWAHFPAGVTKWEAATGVDVDVDVAALHAGTSTEVCQLAYRVIREGLRNVIKHAAASHAQVSARLEGQDAVVSVIDNGTGMASTDPAEPGHLGLRLLNDSLRDVGGTLVLERTAGGGTSLTATFPSTIAAALR